MTLKVTYSVLDIFDEEVKVDDFIAVAKDGQIIVGYFESCNQYDMLLKNATTFGTRGAVGTGSVRVSCTNTVIPMDLFKDKLIMQKLIK